MERYKQVMELVPAMLTARATKMFTEGDDVPRVSISGQSRMRGTRGSSHRM